ncbi:CdaR family protein [uncultured Desulfuromonas sp.]|uniref:CdaR family protein n=1 Tax=uncultured Desulfuromonas sp. TaxID=181013 RepID=UPI002AAC1C81|nr:CdaR family protein [uncultured Desulfuromonas sp.]
MLQLITRNWHLKLLSLIFATLLWLFVTGEQRAEVGYSVPLELKNVPADLIVANEVPSLVNLRISGPRTLLSNLESSSLSLSVDLRGLEPGLTTFKRLDENLNIPSALKVVRLSPSYVEVKLERIREKSVPVTVVLTGEPMPGQKVLATVATPDRASIRGAESEVKRIDHVETEPLDIAGIREDFIMTVPVNFRGTYTELSDKKTVEVEVHFVYEPPIEMDQPDDSVESDAPSVAPSSVN